MECAVTSIGVTVVSVTNSHKSLAAAHVTYAHEHVITPGISWYRITIVVQIVAHNIDNTSDGVRLHVRRQYNHTTVLS